MPKNFQVVDILPKNEAVIDVLPKNEAVIDVLPKNLKLSGELTQSYSVAHTAGVIMLSVPLILYSSAGTETQFSETGRA